MKISSKFALNLSAFTSAIFLIFSLYKGIVLFYVKKAMEDTFVGGNTSDISIILWFVIAGILSLITFMFLFFKIKDLKAKNYTL